jgi:hypothetical protein
MKDIQTIPTDNLPMNAMKQYKYPRLRGYAVGEDGEVTTHLCLGLPCCGLDLLIEHPATMTALELYQIAGEFAALNERVKTLPTFQACQLKPR